MTRTFFTVLLAFSALFVATSAVRGWVVSSSCSTSKLQSDVMCGCSYTRTMGGMPAGCPASSSSKHCSPSATSQRMAISLARDVRRCFVPSSNTTPANNVSGSRTLILVIIRKLIVVVVRPSNAPFVPTSGRYSESVRKERLARFNSLN